jgi:hypothetical protein
MVWNWKPSPTRAVKHSASTVQRLRKRLDEIVDLGVGRETAGLAAGVGEPTIDGHVELTALTRLELDLGGAEFLEAIPHTEGLRLVASSAAEFDEDFHDRKVGPYGAANKGDIR